LRLENLYTNFVTAPPEIQLQILSAYRQRRAEDMAKPNTFRVKAIAAKANALTPEEEIIMKLLRLKKKEVIATDYTELDELVKKEIDELAKKVEAAQKGGKKAPKPTPVPAPEPDDQLPVNDGDVPFDGPR